MSRTTLYAAFNRTERFQPVCVFPNSWGSAAFVWDVMLKKYLPEVWLDGSVNEWPRVWQYEKAGNWMRPWERNTVRATYDGAVCRFGDLVRLSAAFRMFAQAHATPSRACSIQAQAEVLEDLYLRKAQGVAWQQTSVSGFWGDSEDGMLTLEETHRYHELELTSAVVFSP